MKNSNNKYNKRTRTCLLNRIAIDILSLTMCDSYILV